MSIIAVQPELNVVHRIVNDNEASPDEPIKLLEVNAATLATGSVEVFGFDPSHDLPSPSRSQRSRRVSSNGSGVIRNYCRVGGT